MARYKMKISALLILLVLGMMLLSSCDIKSTQPDTTQVAIPTFSPAGGVYDASVDVLISCSTSGAIVRYTTDGTEPNASSTLVEGTVHIAGSTVLKAKAFKQGWPSSLVRTATYTLTTVAPPVFSPPGGVFNGPVNVTLTCSTDGAVIRYTIDGSDPTETSAEYTNTITVNATGQIKARAYVAGKVPSEVSSASFTMQLPLPVFTPPGGYYSTAQMVGITCAVTGCQIRYTIDGSDPEASSPLYVHQISAPVNTMIKAKAFLNGWLPSDIVTTFYIINLPDQMQLVQGGTFNNATSNVTLSSFYIGRKEVTQLEWLMVMDYLTPSPYVDPENAVESMRWYEAIAYCNIRSMIEGYVPCYSYIGYGTDPAAWPQGWDYDPDHSNIACNWNAGGYRLPTEMEWMYAARGGNQSQNYVYSGSNDVNLVAWYNANSSQVMNVGQKQPNELGLYDMSGNVWEFCWDIYNASYYPNDVSNPTGPITGTHRVMRGGSWLNDASNCTLARRFYSVPQIGMNYCGIRLVRKAL